MTPEQREDLKVEKELWDAVYRCIEGQGEKIKDLYFKVRFLLLVAGCLIGEVIWQWMHR